MRRLYLPVHLALLITSPALFAYPQLQEPTFQQFHSQEIYHEGFGLNYDDVLGLLNAIESKNLEDYSEQQLDRITHFMMFLAQQGGLPGEYAAHAELEKDIAALRAHAANFFDYASDAASQENSALLLCKHKHKHKKKHKHEHKKNFFAQVKEFVKKHKKAIIIGAAVIVGATVVVIAVAATSTATAVAVASAAAKAAAANSHRSTQPSETAELESALEDQIISFKEMLVLEEHLDTDLPIEENMRTLGSLFAHQSSQELQQQLGLSPEEDFFAQVGHNGIDQSFSTDYALIYTTPQTDFNTLAYQARGEQALTSGYYEQAVHDLGKAIDLNPTNPLTYLERGVAHFHLGQYDHSIEDYQQYIAQKPTPTEPFSLSHFSLGFAKGLPSGIYDSGEGTLLFLVDLITQPLHTGEQVWDSLVTLKGLVQTKSWETIAETLSPQVHDLIVNWDQLSSYERGELAGYAFGRHGADFLLPAAAAKAAKTCKELVVVSKNLRIAEKTLLLESASNLENGLKIAEVIQNKTMVVAERLGFTLDEIAQLESAIPKGATIIAQDINFTNHALKRAIERGVSRKSILDTFTSPLKIEEVKIDNLGRPSQRMIGQKAEVVINPETQQIISVNPTSTKKFEKLNNEISNAASKDK